MEAHVEREWKLNKINQDISYLYQEYQKYLDQQENFEDIEKRIKVEVDLNLARIMENKLKMDKEVYILKKKLYERTMKLRELQVQIYDARQHNKDLTLKNDKYEADLRAKDKELSRL
eukprot:CAMPEP_0170553352 /NCGR_PEP_ID=MMETSP0211-20121228/11167_1 /TAXON_ID=311385 /ORGANISM="Pseudokeronopsis sp., Strain OXSARD2" /LENGTH=116 /DNA_ID=CAMNT_0010861619 /DNA_START=415 /DNA_END=765 /DNA_ORIENTATION=-